MDMSGEQRIEAPRAIVWAALNDPEILRKCIPGCQELEKQSDTEMRAVATIKVGPVSAKFKGAVTLTDLDPPNGYRISGEGQGGIAGFAKGAAEVRLADDGEATILRYVVSAQIGGKLSQLGSRLIDATARNMSNAFFKRFAEELGARNSTTAPGTQPFSGENEPTSRANKTPIYAHNLASHRTMSPEPQAAPAMVGPYWMWWLNITVLIAAVVVIAGMLSSAGSARLVASVAAGTNFDISSPVLVILLIAVGYLAGRQHEASRSSTSNQQLFLALLSHRQRAPDA